MLTLTKPVLARKVVAPACAALAVALCSMLPAPALADIVVGNGTAASCTTVALTNAISAGNGTITFSCGGGNVSIASPAPDGWAIAGGAQITVDGGNLVTLSGAGAHRVLANPAGATLTLKNLTVSFGLANGDGGAIVNQGTLIVDHGTFTNNNADSAYSGGAILTLGPLTITNSTFMNNVAGNGGAIYARFAGAIVTITDTLFDSNGTSSGTAGWGGAILFWDGATAALTRTTLSNNYAYLGGGAIYVQGAATSLTLKDSQATGNYTFGAAGKGGALYSEGNVQITGTTFQTNRSASSGSITSGGAIDIHAGVAKVDSSRFTHNWAYSGGALMHESGALDVTNSWLDNNGRDASNLTFTADGGAVYVSTGVVTLTGVTMNGNVNGAFYQRSPDIVNAPVMSVLANSTVSGNSGYDYAVEVENGGLALDNTTIAQNSISVGAALHVYNGVNAAIRNTIVTGSAPFNCSQLPPVSLKGNLSGDGSCGFGAGRDNVNVLLGPLANNGGYGPTHLPLAGSPAIDGGLQAACPLLDQRGVVRAGKGAACDVGAVEVAAPGSGIDVDGNGQFDALTDGLMMLRYLFGLRGASLTNGAIGQGATRTGPQIEAYIQSLMQ